MKFFKVNHINLIQWSTGQLQSSRVGALVGSTCTHQKSWSSSPELGEGRGRKGRRKRERKIRATDKTLYCYNGERGVRDMKLQWRERESTE